MKKFTPRYLGTHCNPQSPYKVEVEGAESAQDEDCAAGYEDGGRDPEPRDAGGF